MFSFLDIINHYLGYVTIETNTKSRIYVILGVLGDLYLLYVAYRFAANGFIIRGILVFLVVLILAYFLYLNIMYYFTKKKAKFDVTPVINKVLHIQPKSEEKPISGEQRRYRNIPANGLFDERKTMPSKLESTLSERHNIHELAETMINKKVANYDYNGLGERALLSEIKTSPKHRVYAMGDGALIPYFDLREENGKYEVYAGMNQVNCEPVGHIVQAGFEDIQNLDKNKVKLYLAEAFLVGGKYETAGRAGLIDGADDYAVQIKIAYRKK